MHSPARRRQVGFTARVFGVIALIVLLVIGAASVLSMASLRRVSDTASQRALEQSADLAAQFLAGRARSLAGGARVFVQSPYFRTLVAQRRRDDVLDQAFEAADQLEADWVFITDERGMLIAKSDEPGAGGVPMGDVPLVAGALRGQTTTGFGESSDSVLFQAVGVPIGIAGSAPIGVLVATRVIGGTVARDMKATTGSELVFYTRGRDAERHIAVATVDADISLVSGIVDAPASSAGANANQKVSPNVRIGNTDFLAQGASLTTAGGEMVGGFVLLRARDSDLTGFAGVRRSLMVASVLGLLLALGAAYFAARFVTRPMHALARTVRRAADGDYLATVSGAEMRGMGTDGAPEMSALAQAVDALLMDLRGKEALMRVAPPSVVHGSAPSDLPRVPERGTAAARAGGMRRSLVQPSASGGARPRALERSDIGLEIGAMLAGRYAIESVIGSGGLGIVYRARDLVVDEVVAVKMLRPELVLTDEQAIERLKHELRVARRVSHRNVVRTHDIGESNGVPFLTMEYVDGAALSEIVTARGALPVPAVLSIALQLLRALAVTAEQGIVHGDLKPANVLVGPSGVVKVTDFGVARFVRSGAAAHRSTNHGVHTDASPAIAHLGGAVVGTPEYMAPEQLLGESASETTDIYAAGILLQECLVGSLPNRADTPVAFLASKLQSETPAARVRVLLESANGDSAVHRLVAEMLEPDAARRPASAAALYARFAALA